MSIEEQHKLTKWLDEDEVNRKVLKKIELYWKSHLNDANTASDFVWEGLVKRIMQAEMRELNKQSNRFTQYAFKVAAVLLIGLVVSYLLINYEEAPIKGDQIRYLEKVSLNGQKINVQLADGSKIKLNAGSKLITPEKFNGDTREVELSGEAFFDIARDPEKPFIIKSGDLSIKVLGTSFNVRAYPEDNEISVAVAEGKVSLSNHSISESPTILLQDQIAIYDKDIQVTRTGSFDPREYFGWKDRQIVFKNSNIDEIFSRLTRWYGVSFEVTTDVDKKRDFSGFYSDDPSLEEVLKGISYVYEFEYEIKKNNVIIR